MAVTTTVSRGFVRELTPSLTQGFCGGSLSIADIEVDERLVYAQYSDGHLVHATLSRAFKARARGGAGERRGALSFTPAGHDRSGAVERGRIVGAEISFEPTFLSEACEQARPLDWRLAFNERDDKAFALAEELAEACRRRAPPLTRDMLGLALARRLGRAYGGLCFRRDDGWLHPRAFMRVVDRMVADPVHVSLTDLALEAGLGVSAFVRGFRGTVGQTPIAFALDLRLDKAADALLAGDRTLAEIATLTGFSSASHLARTFRARRGLPPGRWRKETILTKACAPSDGTKSAQTITLVG